MCTCSQPQCEAQQFSPSDSVLFLSFKMYDLPDVHTQLMQEQQGRRWHEQADLVEDSNEAGDHGDRVEEGSDERSDARVGEEGCNEVGKGREREADGVVEDEHDPERGLVKRDPACIAHCQNKVVVDDEHEPERGVVKRDPVCIAHCQNSAAAKTTQTIPLVLLVLLGLELYTVQQCIYISTSFAYTY